MLVYQQHVNFFFSSPIRIQKTLETGEGKRGLKMEDGTYAAIGSYHFCCGSDYYDPRCQDFDELSYFDDVLKVTSKSHRYDTATQ